MSIAESITGWVKGMQGRGNLPPPWPTQTQFEDELEAFVKVHIELVVTNIEDTLEMAGIDLSALMNTCILAEEMELSRECQKDSAAKG